MTDNHQSEAFTTTAALIARSAHKNYADLWELVDQAVAGDNTREVLMVVALCAGMYARVFADSKGQPLDVILEMVADVAAGV